MNGTAAPEPVRCPQCRSTNTRIADSRSDERGLTARRRQCNRCSHRFSTIVWEEIEQETAGQHTTYSQLNAQRPAKHQP